MVESYLRTRIGRLLGAALLLFLAAYFALVLAASIGENMVDDVIENSRKLESDFQETSRFRRTHLKTI
jgi:hypothetical protein